jgi:hypothetical protein
MLKNLFNTSLSDFDVCCWNNFLSTIFQHTQHLAIVNCVLLIFLWTVTALLHYQMINFEFSRGSLHNLLFNWTLSNKAVNDHLLFLSDSMGTVDCLQVNLGIPITVENYYDVGSMQINSKSTCSSRENEYLLLRLWILEIIDTGFSVVSRSLPVDPAIFVFSIA